MNILADLQTAIQSINRFNEALSDFKQHALEIATLYREDAPEPFLKRLDNVLSRYSHKDIFLLLSFLIEDAILNKTIKKLDDQPRDILEKVFIDPLVREKDKLPQLIKLAMLKGYIEDKEIILFWSEQGIDINKNQLQYQVKKLGARQSKRIISNQF